MLSFVVLAKKNLGANPVIVGLNNLKHRFISQMHRFKSHTGSKDSEQSLSESVNLPLQAALCGTSSAHVELWARERFYLAFSSS